MTDAKHCPCGGTILADTEDWKTPLCSECYEECGEPMQDPQRYDDLVQMLQAADELYESLKALDDYRTRPTKHTVAESARLNERYDAALDAYRALRAKGGAR